MTIYAKYIFNHVWVCICLDIPLECITHKVAWGRKWVEITVWKFWKFQASSRVWMQHVSYTRMFNERQLRIPSDCSKYKPWKCTYSRYVSYISIQNVHSRHIACCLRLHSSGSYDRLLWTTIEAKIQKLKTDRIYNTLEKRREIGTKFLHVE